MRLIPGILSAVLVGALVPALSAPPQATAAAKPCSAGYVALTFDSGPTLKATPTLLDVLRQHGVQATFFLLGSRVGKNPELVRRLAAERHVVANHTWSHPDLTTLTDAEIRSEVGSTRAALEAVGVKPSRLVRPPSGRIDVRVAAVIRQMGLVPVNWTVSSYDWTGIGSSQIVSNVLRGIRPYAVNNVLLHEAYTQPEETVATVRSIIAGARTSGYCFTTLGNDALPVLAPPKVTAKVSVARERRRTPARVSVTLKRAVPWAVPIWLRTARGTAVAGKDYRHVNKVVWIPAGTRTASVAVRVINDRKRERKEWFSVYLRGDKRSQLAPTRMRAWVVSNDR